MTTQTYAFYPVFNLGTGQPTIATDMPRVIQVNDNDQWRALDRMKDGRVCGLRNVGVTLKRVWNPGASKLLAQYRDTLRWREVTDSERLAELDAWAKKTVWADTVTA